MGLVISRWGSPIRRLMPAHLVAMASRPHAAASFERAGDEALAFSATFEQFFRQYEPRITGYLWRMVGDEAAACDLCQETFIRAWQHFSVVQAAQSPAAWLFRVATNLALNDIRARTRGARAALPFDVVDDPASSDPSVRFVEQSFVQQILAELSPKQRALLILRDVYQLSFDDVAAMLHLSPHAVRMALSRARAKFRDHYLQKGRN